MLTIPSPSPRVSRLSHRASTASSISIYSQHEDADPVSTITTLVTAPTRPFLTPAPSPSPTSGLLPPPNHTSHTGVTATVAELRRMNSCISTASSSTPEPYITAATSANAHIHPLLRDRHTTILASGIGSVAKRSRASGNKYYLSLGVTPPRNHPARSRNGRQSVGTVSLGGSPRRGVGVPRTVSRKMSVSPVRFQVGTGEENENVIEGGVELQEFSFAAWEDGEEVLKGNKNVAATPAAKRRRYESGRKGSQDSLGLYDQDGFLIGMPSRYGGASQNCKELGEGVDNAEVEKYPL